MTASKTALTAALASVLLAACPGTAHAAALAFAYELYYLTPLTERLTVLALAAAAAVLCYVRLWRGANEGPR